MIRRAILVLGLLVAGCNPIEPTEHKHIFKFQSFTSFPVEHFWLSKNLSRCDCGQLLIETSWIDDREEKLIRVKKELGYKDQETGAIWK